MKITSVTQLIFFNGIINIIIIYKFLSSCLVSKLRKLGKHFFFPKSYLSNNLILASYDYDFLLSHVGVASNKWELLFKNEFDSWMSCELHMPLYFLDCIFLEF